MRGFASLSLLSSAWLTGQLVYGSQEHNKSLRCRCLYGDPCWPSEADFAQLSLELSHPLVKPTPLAQPCYLATTSRAHSSTCSIIAENWDNGTFRSDHPGAMEAPNFETFTSRDGELHACFLNSTLAPTTSHNPIDHSKHHRILLSNFFAQPEALAFGKTEQEVRNELGPNASDALVKSKIFEGNRPSNSIMFPLLTPATLGALIALYEHKIFTQGVVWGINSFDQMGVELGKVLAKNILKQLDKPEDVTGHDSSTTGLIHYYQKWRKE
ncbi:hypothetical protein NUW54_g9733 [Trametes sanguinea]|uniref:Uncharacterized protein n=1 Tax=Trametes sanguinea TaxID=158606 RepID=A0ACC1P652_9APHY|nr:hypothetical protein NUW54_g9733 [Trametes sanguinea]